jgi:acylphosphatase
MRELRATISGSVQGVGFRYLVQRYARRLHLRGWVRNCANGDVELCAQGDEDLLAQLVTAIQENSGAARIHHLDASYHVVSHPLTDFEIRL